MRRGSLRHRFPMLECCMPFLDPAIVHFRSDQSLCHDVANYSAKQAWNGEPAKTPNVVPKLLGRRRVNPLDVLHQVGFATTPAVMSRRQAGFRTTWAHVRYFWAFASMQGNLALSIEAASLKFHHRATLSEYLGIGFALEAVFHFTQKKHSSATIICVDAEELLEQSLAAGLIAPIGNKLRPDYFVIASEPSGVVGAWALECKGSKKRGGEIERLAKATRQVESVRLHLGGAPAGIVCSTVADFQAIKVSILDPEGDPRWLGPFGADQSANVIPGESVDLVGDPAAMRSNALALDAARLLTWSGAYASAKSIAPPWLSEIHQDEAQAPTPETHEYEAQAPTPETREYEDRAPTRVTIGSKTYHGLESSFPTEEGVARVFHGVESHLRQTLIDLSKKPNRSALIELRTERLDDTEVEWDLARDEFVSTDRSGAITRFILER